MYLPFFSLKNKPTKKKTNGYSNVPHLELLILKDCEILTLKASDNNA